MNYVFRPILISHIKVGGIASALLSFLLFSCASEKYFLVVNQSSTEINVKYKVDGATEGIFYENPKLIKYLPEAKVGSDEMEIIDSDPDVKVVSVDIPAGISLQLGAFKGKMVEGDLYFNMEEITIKSLGGSVSKQREEVRKIFHKDRRGNYRVLITH